jgi:hypothetical protein
MFYLGKVRKMTGKEITERNNEILQLRIEGHTMSEIGKIFGMSKQRVCQIVNSLVGDETIFRARKEQLDIEKIRFQGIYEMFKKDYRMSYKKFQCIASHTKRKSNALTERWRRYLVGLSNEIEIELSWINNLIEYSGMSYEELFAPREVK